VVGEEFHLLNKFNGSKVLGPPESLIRWLGTLILIKKEKREKKFILRPVTNERRIWILDSI